MEDQWLVTIISMVLAALSFIGFATPFLKKSEKKEHYKNVIEKRRKSLYESHKSGEIYKASPEKKGRDVNSLAALYKMQQMAGDMGENVRDRMLQAGIRSPSAPIKFMILQGVLPIIFCALVMMILSASDKDIAPIMTLLYIFIAAVSGYKLPDLLIKNTIQKRQDEIALSFPDSLDMMLICVQGGIGLEQTISRVAMEVSDHSEVLAEELGILSTEMAMLNDRRKALQDFARRVGSGAAKSFATSLIQAEQYGTSISQAMRVLSDEIRDMRMSKAEQKAASLPPKLTVPMILFFLPALFIIILGPAGIEAASAGIGK
ncbi:MAG: type II secretion system F family protein [Micavibrio sp.]|nr:type II secretion system F family protein [Micavibrio sp.]